MFRVAVKENEMQQNNLIVICLIDLYSAIEYKSLGCYQYNKRMTVLEGQDPDMLDGDYKLRADAIEKCALAAIKLRYAVFAIHDGGSCLASDTVHPTFNKFGISQDCKSDGKGGPGATHVYVPGSIQGMLCSSYEWTETVILDVLLLLS